MSRLHHNEKGHVSPWLGEELSRMRHARVQINLPATTQGATLYLLGMCHKQSTWPLRISINGHELPPVVTRENWGYLWCEVAVPSRDLRDGSNEVILWTDSVAMNAWSLALDPAEPQGRSAVSYDAGATWHDHGLGYLSNMRGEYVVRIRLTEGQDPEPPEMIWEDSDHPAVAALREILPTDVTRDASRLERVQRLSSWLASSWEHTNSDRTSQYAPWDAATILEWGKSEVGHNGVRPVVMCVQFAVAFVSACQALGIAARCAAVTRGVHTGEGHFVAEVWLPECEKWVLVDPNTDAMFWKGDEPLSLKEVQAHIGDLSGIIRFGGGAAFQRQFTHMAKFMDSTLVTGACYTHRSIWPRADFLSRPDLSPPAHGAQAYCETDLVWESSDLTDGFGMFCSFVDPDHFDRPPHFS